MAKREYIQANKDWLEAKAKEEGVKTLPKGIYYKVLSEGNQSSPHPSVRSIITAHYTGKTINGIYLYIVVLPTPKSFAASMGVRYGLSPILSTMGNATCCPSSICFFIFSFFFAL